MPIEFRCTQCDKLLRTADDTGGKQAKCPECGAVVRVPSKVSPPAPESPSPIDENPFRSSTTAPPVQDETTIAPTQIDMGDVINRTWEIFKREWGMCVVVFVIYIFIYGGCSVVTQLVSTVAQVAGGNEVLAITISVLTQLIVSLLQIWLQIGLCLFFLKKARGQSAEISDLFTGGPYFVSVILATLAVGLLSLCVLAVFAIPGLLIGRIISREAIIVGGVVGGGIGYIALIVVWLYVSQFYYLILDKNLGPIDSLRVSIDIMWGNKLTLFLTYLITGLAGTVLTLLTCGLGALVAVPFLTLLMPVIYLAITGQPTADQNAA